MSSTRIEARLRAVEEMLASPPPVELQMRDGRIETVPVNEEDDLAFVINILGRPLSREAEMIGAVQILGQPGHLVELLQAVMEHPNDIKGDANTPNVVQRLDGERKIKPFGSKIKEWARRNPDSDAWLNILTGSVALPRHGALS